MLHTRIKAVEDGSYEPLVAALERIVPQEPLTALPALVGELERLKTMALARIVGERVMTTAQEDDLLTMPEVASRLKISRHRAYELARQGILNPVRVGRLVRVETRELTNYLLQRGR
jgi:excisionase family DNA binding protein